MAKRWYMGYASRGASQPLRQVFASDHAPTADGHPEYAAVVGPFRTKRAAVYMAESGQGNPHLQTVDDAERIVRENAIAEGQANAQAADDWAARWAAYGKLMRELNARAKPLGS
jgi:hypothetical protein